MESAITTLDQAVGLLAGLARLPFGSLDDETACEIVVRAEQLGRLVDTIRALSAADIEERSRFELGSDGLAYRLGHRRGVHLVERLTRTSQADATRRIRLGTAIAPRTTLDGRALPAAYPRVAAAMIDGTMGADAASQIVRCLEQAARNHATTDGLEAAEAALVDTSAFEPADIVAVHARVWREALDPDGAEPRDDELRQRRRFSLGREAHGLTPFSGACDPTSAALLRTAFAESAAPDAKPRFLSEDEILRGTSTTMTSEGQIVESVHDPRTREQRQLDVLMGLVMAGLRSTGLEPGGMRSTATVMAVVRLTDLERGTGVGWLDDVAESVSAATIRELECDAGHRKIVLGDDGEVLYLGILERYFSPAQRRALAVRDGGCVWPQCTAPPGWCHAHHVIEAQYGGPTDIDNGVLLCPAHHHMLHHSPFTMKMFRGKPRLLAPPWIDPDQVWRPIGRTRATITVALQ